MKRSIVILLHFGYWLLYWMLVSFIILATFQGRKHFPLSVFFISPIAIATLLPGILGFYASYFILFENFLNRKNIFRLVFAGIMTAIGSSLLSCLFLQIAFGRNILFADGYNSAIGIFITLFLLALINAGTSLVLKGFINWYGELKLREELNKKNYETELALLKSQINPHFLFNTINNIDTLITKDAVRASSYLNKLSDIMRFMLYETKTEKIPLSKELTYIDKFIELQKIRTSNQHYINYHVKGELTNVMIPPMLFISFIENAFKHTENKKTENAININLEIENDKIHFTCENNYNPRSQMTHDGNGLGSALIKKRLPLLYPDKHRLTITNNNELYKVELTLH